MEKKEEREREGNRVEWANLDSRRGKRVSSGEAAGMDTRVLLYRKEKERVKGRWLKEGQEGLKE